MMTLRSICGMAAGLTLALLLGGCDGGSSSGSTGGEGDAKFQEKSTTTILQAPTTGAEDTAVTQGGGAAPTKR